MWEELEESYGIGKCFNYILISEGNNDILVTGKRFFGGTKLSLFIYLFAVFKMTRELGSSEAAQQQE